MAVQTPGMFATAVSGDAAPRTCIKADCTASTDDNCVIVRRCPSVGRPIHADDDRVPAQSQTGGNGIEASFPP
ncbi:MAG: hypothetical protein KGJ78_04110 [Alphaproteobacteria bacterium]|nr:hypothetical protein [Alphaproteobacteria bacterium]